MKLSIVTAVCGQNLTTKSFIHSTLAQCSEPHELVVVSNGTTQEDLPELLRELDELRARGWKAQIHIHKEPLGTTKAFDSGARAANGEIIVMIHNDVTIFVKDWDKKVIEFFDSTPNAGVCGFVGAKGLGAHNIYQTPYELTQLARHDVYASLDDARDHGKEIGSEPVEVAVLDGLTLIVKKSVFEEIGGFELQYVHHMYDNDLCLSANKHGYTNYVLPIMCHHRGGMTSCGTEYGEWAKENYDGDIEIHKRSHEIFYEKWRGFLPVTVQ